VELEKLQRNSFAMPDFHANITDAPSDTYKLYHVFPQKSFPAVLKQTTRTVLPL
jgi:hypothetical protein